MSLQKTIGELRKSTTRRRNPEGDVGIEIEVEGVDAVREHDNFRDDLIWDVVQDGSLRQGAEYVLKNPVKIKDVSSCVDHWAKKTTGIQFNKDSIRTSVHFHVNVNDMTLEDVYKSIGLSWLVENILLSLCHEDRRGNLFCLRLSDADGLFESVIDNLRNNGNLMYFRDPDLKYAALNLKNISKLGSLEYRFVNGTTDPHEIKFWVNVFYNLVHASENLSSQDILEIMSYDIERLPKILFTSEALDRIYKVLTNDEICDMLRDNYIYILELLQTLQDQATKVGTVVKSKNIFKQYGIHNEPEDFIDWDEFHKKEKARDKEFKEHLKKRVKTKTIEEIVFINDGF